jgi:hypothetical protein
VGAMAPDLTGIKGAVFEKCAETLAGFSKRFRYPTFHLLQTQYGGVAGIESRAPSQELREQGKEVKIGGIALPPPSSYRVDEVLRKNNWSPVKFFQLV